MEKTFAEDIEEAAKGEPIDSVVIGTFGDSWLDDEDEVEGGPRPVLPWAAARSQLDYAYGTGYGGVECHAIYAWTQTRVLFVSEYDGSTKIASVPRNPTEGKPIFP